MNESYQSSVNNLPYFLWAIGVLFSMACAWFIVGYPKWNVWAAHMKGLADLAQAQNEQQVLVAEAKGRLDAAEMNKRAAIIEAEAVAEQIKRIGEGLSHHDLYLKWQWIKMMEEREGETIYVPTEASLPILEASRFVKGL